MDTFRKVLQFFSPSGETTDSPTTSHNVNSTNPHNYENIAVVKTDEKTYLKRLTNIDEDNVIFSTYLHMLKKEPVFLFVMSKDCIYIVVADNCDPLQKPKYEIKLADINKVTISPGRDNVIVFHCNPNSVNSDIVITMDLVNDTATNNKRGTLLKLFSAENPECPVEKGERTITAMRKGKLINIKFTCATYPEHSGFYSFIKLSDNFYEYNVQVRCGRKLL